MKALRHIMCVDDDEDILEIIRLSLELQDGLTVTCCGSGALALAMVTEVAPDLVLLDAMMPQMDGPETFARLRRINSDLPVVFLTAKIQAAEIDAYLAMGAIGVLAKPFDPMSLFEEIERLWNAGGKGGPHA